MWVQLDADAFQRLAGLAEKAKMLDVANRIHHALSVSRSMAATIDRYREAARAGFGEDGVLEFDHDAAVSFSDDQGAYVMGWRWVELSPRAERGANRRGRQLITFDE